MSLRSQFLLALSPFLTLALFAVSMAAPPASTIQRATSRLGTFEKATGESYFALSLSPTEKLAPAPAHDVLIMFDTSASQTGLYRDDAIGSLNKLLNNLGEKDRVKLLAVDLNAIPLTAGFVAPNSPQMKAALEKLNHRIPLGSTDMARTIQAASSSFQGKPTVPRAAIYIGDGVSKANWLSSDEFAQLVKELVDQQVAFSSYAIGPQRDMHLLAALANHTGGMLLIDSDQTGAADRAGVNLSQIVQGVVYWPTSAKLPAAMTEVFPKTIPPLRSDRDMILIGTLDKEGPQQISITALVNGKNIDLRWTVSPEPLGDELAFLPNLIDFARKDAGIRLPTVGSAGRRRIGIQKFREKPKKPAIQQIPPVKPGAGWHAC